MKIKTSKTKKDSKEQISSKTFSKQPSSNRNSNNIVHYGCVVSLLLDDCKFEAEATLNYDSDEEREKMNQIKKKFEEITLRKKSTRNNIYNISDRVQTDEIIPPKNSDSSKNLEIRDSNRDSIRSKRFSRKDNNMNQKILNLDEKFIKDEFLFSKGVFSDNFILNSFSSIQNFQVNYVNSLFRIIPAVEYESKERLEKWFYHLNKSAFQNESVHFEYRDLKEVFIKYKQEILTNHENLIKTVSKKLPVNFDDSIQLLHVQTGKFLRFFLNKDNMKMYLKLSTNPSKYTIFRIRPGFAYQTEYSTNIYFNFGVEISCGDLTSNKEMFLCKPVESITDEKFQLFTKDKNNNLSIEEIRKEWENHKTKFSIDKLANFTRNLATASNKSTKKRWKLIKYSDNFEMDNKYLNNFDMFWINNCEKDVFIYASQEEASLFSTKFFSKTMTSFDEGKDKIKSSNKLGLGSNYTTGDNQRKNNKKMKTDSPKDYKSCNKLRIIKDKNSKNNVIANFNENKDKPYLKYLDKEEKFQLDEILMLANETIPTNINENKEILTQSQQDKVKENPDKQNLEKNINLVNKPKSLNQLDQLLTDSVNMFSFDDINSEFKTKLNLNVKYIQINEKNNPFGLFKFEPILMKINETRLNEIQKEINYSIELYPNVGPQIKKELFLIRNVFSNTLISIDNKTMGLRLINQNDINNFEDCLFQIEQVYEKTEKEGEGSSANIDKDNLKLDSSFSASNKNSKKFLKKSDMIRIKSKKYKAYLAVKTFGKDSFGLTATKNLSDLTIFKLDFINLEDRILVNFCDQLNCSIDHMLNYFLEKKDENSLKNSSDENFSSENLKNEIDQIVQLTKLRNIFSELKEKLKNYKLNKTKAEKKEGNKVDLMTNLKEFKIIEKIVKLKLSIWFRQKLPQNQTENEKPNQRENNFLNVQNPNKYHNSKSLNKLCSFEENIINNNIEEELEKINENSIQDNLLLQLQVECTNLTIKILKICYDLDNSILLSIENYLPYFFKFVGKIHECTRFLIYILRNNNSQLLKLITSNNQSAINEMKKSLVSYVKLGNFDNNESFSLFYELLNIMLMCNDEPFKPFYKVILSDMNLFNEYEDEKFQDVRTKPNLDNLFMIDFQLVEDKIYFSKKFNMIAKDNASESECFIKTENDLESGFEVNKQKEIFAKTDSDNNITNIELKFFNLNLEDYDRSYTNIDKETIKKLITMNLNFYSNFSLHDEKFRNHLLNIFKMETINKYLSENTDDYTYYLPEEIKCALIRVINYLYLKEKEEKLQNLYLCRKITCGKNTSNFKFWKSISKQEMNFDIKNIVLLIEEKLQNHIKGRKNLTHDLLLQIIESCQYIIRSFYYNQNKSDTASIKEYIFKLMSSLISILENNIGINSAKMSKRSTYYEFDEMSVVDRDAKEKLLHELKYEKISLDNLNIDLNNEVISNLNQNSPYIKLYQFNKLKFLDLLTSAEKLTHKMSVTISKSTKTMTYGSIRKLIKTDNFNDEEVTTIRNFTRGNNKTSNKDSRHEILKRICIIFKEFLKYVENTYILKIEENIINLVQNFDSNNLSREYIDSMNIITKNVYNFSDSNELEFMNILDEFAFYHKKKKVETNSIEDQNKQVLNSFEEVLKKKILPKQEEYLIINIFFECLQRIDNMDLKIIIFDILYRVNSQRMILFENVSNMVILSEANEVKVFDELKETLTNLNTTMINLNSTYEKDDSALLFIGKFKKHLRRAINIICNSARDNMINNNTISNNTMDNQMMKMEEKKDPKENISNLNILNPTKSALGIMIRDSHKSHNLNAFELMKDLTSCIISNLQYVLKNLDVHVILINFMKKANEIMERFIKLGSYKGANEELFIEIEVVISNLYELLALFIKDNKKHKFIVEEDIETILFPIFIKNYLNQEIMTNLSNFLLEFIKNFKLSDLNSIGKLIDMMQLLVKNMDWFKDREIIPNWVEIMKVIIKTPQIEYDDRIVYCFDRFRRYLVHELVHGKITKKELKSVTDLLKLLMEVRNSTNEEFENQTKFILPLKEIVSIWNTLTNDEEEVHFEVLNITIDYLYMNIFQCKTELANNKQFLRKLETNLLKFVDRNEKTILSKVFERNENHDKKEEEYLLSFNLFVGVSIPKLSFIIKQISFVENIRQTVIDAISKALNLTEILVNHIKDKMEAIGNATERAQYMSLTFLNEIGEVELKKLFSECTNIKNPTINIITDCKKLLTEIFEKMKEEEKKKEEDEKMFYVKRIKSMSIKILRRKSKNQTPIQYENKNEISSSVNIEKTKPNPKVNSYTKTSIWNFIREILNNPYIVINDSNLSEFDTNFYRNLNSYVNRERQNLIENIIFYYAPRISGIGIQKEKFSPENEKIQYETDSLSQIFQFIKIINNIFLVYIDRNTKIKEKLYFYYWILIHFMKYDVDKKSFTNNPSMRNKFVFSESNFLLLISKILRKKNLKCIDYTIAIIIKYFTTYLNKLDDDLKILFNEFLIKNVESENIFLIMKNILENLKSKLSKFENKTEYKEELLINYMHLQGEWKTVNFDLAKYENYINPFEEMVQMISYLVESRQRTHYLIKDYLRYQGNCSKSSNFISLMQSVIECFVSNGEKNGTNIKNFKKKNVSQMILEIENENSNFQSAREDQNLINQTSNQFNTVLLQESPLIIKGNLIQFYYPTLIKLIESLTKCCSGPCLENQNFLINDTKILEFISVILFKISYRPNILNKEVIDCRSINLSRKKLSFLKLKILIFVCALVEGRKKNDKIFEAVVKYIDYVSLSNIMMETIQEIMIEKNIDNFDDLVMVEDLYQRFQGFKINSNSENDESKFIIFEIGTFVYVIMNNFHDNWHEMKTDRGSIKSIKEMRKILSSIRQQTKRENAYSTCYEFFKKLVLSVKGLINLFLFRKKKIFTEEYCQNIIQQENFYFKCYEFYFKYTPRIEIIFNNDIMSYYVKLFPMCQYLNREMKDDFQEYVDRTNTISKLNYLFKRIYYFNDALSYSQKLEELYKKIPLADLILNQYKFFRDFSFLITIILNFMLVASYCRKDDEYIYSFLYKLDNPTNINGTRIALSTLGVIQFCLSGLIFINYIIRNKPKYTYLDSNQLEERPTFLKKSFTFVFRIFKDFNFLYYSAYFLFAFFAYYSKKYFLFSFHLLESARRSSTLTNLILALWIPGRQLMVTIFLFVVFQYYFVIFIFLFFYDDVDGELCHSFDSCVFTIIDQTFKNSNGIINYLSEEKYEAEFFLGRRFWLDNLFAIIMIMLILQMIAGIIIDNFSALRENLQKINEDKYNVCFICGLSKNELNKLYGNEEGYSEHVKLDHYYWNYMFLIFNLLRKDKFNLNGLDLFIYKNYKNQNYGWIPQET